MKLKALSLVSCAAVLLCCAATFSLAQNATQPRARLKAYTVVKPYSGGNAAALAGSPQLPLWTSTQPPLEMTITTPVSWSAATLSDTRPINSPAFPP